MSSKPRKVTGDDIAGMQTHIMQRALVHGVTPMRAFAIYRDTCKQQMVNGPEEIRPAAEHTYRTLERLRDWWETQTVTEAQVICAQAARSDQ